VETADVVQTDVRFYLESAATVDGYRTVPSESRKGTPVVLYGRRATPEMVGQIRIDGELDDELGCVDCRERGQYFQEGRVDGPFGRVKFDVLNDPTPVDREFVGCGIEFQARLDRNLLVCSPQTHIKGRVGDEVSQHPIRDVEQRLDCFVKGFLFQHMEYIVPADQKRIEGPVEKRRRTRSIVASRILALPKMDERVRGPVSLLQS